MDAQTDNRFPRRSFRVLMRSHWIILAAGCLAMTSLLMGCILHDDQEQKQRFSTEVARLVAIMQTGTAQSAGIFTFPTSALTPIPPSLSPTLPGTPAGTLIPVACDQAALVADFNRQNGAVYPPGARVEKIWRIQNTGSCTWSPDYDLVFERGDRMNGPSLLALPGYVLPGETIDVTIWLTAPIKEGYYQGTWRLRNANDMVFGLNNPSESPLVAALEVRGPNSAYVYDFAGNACFAAWGSASGHLPCVSSDGETGFITVLYNPAQENGFENLPALWTRPNQANGGWISGSFPEILVEHGDHFRATVGCLANNPACDVIFSLDYQLPGKPVVNLNNWREVYDGYATYLDIDLGFLAGKEVIFALRVNVNNANPEAANAFWQAPRIVHIHPTNTPTLTPTRTISPIPTNTSTATGTPTSLPIITIMPTHQPVETSIATVISTLSPTRTTSPTDSPTTIPPVTQTPTPTATQVHTTTPTAAITQEPCSPYPRSGILPMRDSWVDRSKPDTRHARDSQLHVRPSGNVDHRALLQFDLSSIPPGSRITSASLFLNDETGGNYLVEFRRVTSKWDDSVTWNTQPTFDSTSSGSIMLSRGPCVRAGQIDPKVVQGWLDSSSTNYGLMLFPSSGAGDASFTSREGSPAPLLVVSYSPLVTMKDQSYVEQGAEYIVLMLLLNLGLSMSGRRVKVAAKAG